jgi:hypothetical protein
MFLAGMAKSYSTGGLDLEDDDMTDFLHEEHFWGTAPGPSITTPGPSITTDEVRNVEHEKHASGRKIGISASADTDAATGQTISSDDSGRDEEVQSMPCSQADIQKPFPGMMFDTLEAAKLHYNMYAKVVGFSIKTISSKNYVLDGEKDRQLFVCNKNGKNKDINEKEVPPVRQHNRSITKKTECKARLRVKRKGQKWHVTLFLEDHGHPLIKKFLLKKYLRSHKGIPREEKDFINLLHMLNLSAGRVMRIMSEVYGSLENVPYDSKDVINFMAIIDNEKQPQRHGLVASPSCTNKEE